MQQFTPNASTGFPLVGAAANKLLMKTYLLLSATLIFSGLLAGYAMSINMPPMNPILMIVGYIVLLFAIKALEKSRWAIVLVFALTGLLGITVGPMLNMIMHGYANGGQIVMTALGGTGLIFVVISAYAVISRKDFSYMGGFLAVAMTAAFLLGIAGFLFNIPTLSLVISGAFILLSSALILFETSMIVRGGETSYIMATVTLYVALFNIFVNLLRLLSAFSGRN